MWRNVLFMTLMIMFLITFLIVSTADFLLPYKPILIREHTRHLIIYFALLTFNVFVGVLWFTRKFMLKDSGRKLAHLDKEIRAGNLMQELSERLAEE